ELAGLASDDLAAYLSRTARPAAQDGRAPGGGGGEGGEGSEGGEALWDLVLEVLRSGKDPAGGRLAEVLSTPLMIALARTMYSEAPGRDPAELLDAGRFP
ncbi:XRE family transcriptional regulator, partial [Streptomyces sp. SID7499]|nr:XRE family transcriptional regulator [Streptomyces sp. SID7499]